MKNSTRPAAQTPAAPTDYTAALHKFDEADILIDRATELLGMIAAVGRICGDPNNQTAKEDLRAIFSGFAEIGESAQRDLTVAARVGAEALNLIRHPQPNTGGAR